MTGIYLPTNLVEAAAQGKRKPYQRKTGSTELDSTLMRRADPRPSQRDPAAGLEQLLGTA